MERSGNFYKAIRLGYILISILIGCMAYNSLYEWQEIEALELGNKKIDELRKEINNINIQMIKFSLLGETILEWNDKDIEHCSLCVRMKTLIMWGGISTNVLKAKDSLVKRQPDCWIIFSERRAHGVSMDLWKMTISAPNAYANVLVCAAKDVSKSL